MKHRPRLCKGCHEPTDTYHTGCRTCQARHRAILLHRNPQMSPGRPICPRCWRTAGLPLAACSIHPKNYGQIIEIENQWNPIHSICRACIHAPLGTVPLDSPRVYLPVNPRARRTSKQRIYPSRANPVLFLALSHCTSCEKPIDEKSRHAGWPLCRKHYQQLKRRSAPNSIDADRVSGSKHSTEYAIHDAGLASFLQARRVRLSRTHTSHPRRNRVIPYSVNAMPQVHSVS